MTIAQFRYINIQPQTIDFSTRLWGINYRVCGVYSPEPRGDIEIGLFEVKLYRTVETQKG